MLVLCHGWAPPQNRGPRCSMLSRRSAHQLVIKPLIEHPTLVCCCGGAEVLTLLKLARLQTTINMGRAIAAVDSALGTEGAPPNVRASVFMAELGACLFIISGSLFWAGWAKATEGNPMDSNGGFEEYKKLNTTTLEAIWTARRKAEGLYLGAEATGAIAWFSILPVIGALCTLWRVRSATAVMKACFFAVAIISFIDFTFQAGLVQTTDWLSSWALMTTTAHKDEFGPIQALEIAYLVTNSRTIWLFAFDEFFLFAGFALAAFIVYTSRSHGNEAGEPFTLWHAHLSLLCGLLALVGFILSLLRAVSWGTFTRPAGIIYAILFLILLPIWIICSRRRALV